MPYSYVCGRFLERDRKSDKVRKKVVTNLFEFPHVQEALDACVSDKANIIKGVIKIS